MKFTTLLLFVFYALSCFAIPGSAGPYKIDVRTDPAVTPVGKANVLVQVRNLDGHPVGGATVSVFAQMPGMPMGEREEAALPTKLPGEYSAPAVFGMAGRYDCRVKISGPYGSGEATVSFSTGDDTAAAGGLSPWFAGAGLAVIAVLAALAWMFRSKRRPNLKGMVSGQVLFSIVLLGCALAVATWVVRTQRRPGAMTPLEAQVMEMNVPAPDGTLPVRLVSARTQSFSSTVTYTGQAVGFVEQSVIPRVTGSIVWMPYYVGEKVRKGQVLARLDTSQIDPMVSEKSAGVNTAQQQVGVSSMEYEQALNAVNQAQAEVSESRGAVQEASAAADSAKESKSAAESGVQTALADVEWMKSDLASDQSDLNYRQQELQRAQRLMESGYISKSEWQKAGTEARQAQATVDKAEQSIRRSEAALAAARAEVRKADADLTAAGRRVQQAQAEVRAKEAAVQTAKSGAAAAKRRIDQSMAGVSQAMAGLKGATTERSYAELKSEVDGVITERTISPGVVVSAGQEVLKVAQISPLRIQANVPEADLARIHLGAKVQVRRRDIDEAAVSAVVTSVSPSVDPASRTGIVEALYDNPAGKWVPGQYVTMEVQVDTAKPATVIPSSAVLAEEGQSYVWIAHTSAGSATIERRNVRVGGKSEDKVAIDEGLADGDQVLAEPSLGLSPGMRVAAIAEGSQSGTGQTVEITAEGYKPNAISIPVGKPSRLTFILRDQKSCATEVVFPKLGIHKQTPLNQAVTVDLPAQESGKEIDFTCQMNMLQGKAVVQ